MWVGFFRIYTNTRIFPVNSSVSECSAFADALVAQPSYVKVSGLMDGLDPFLQLLERVAVKANLVNDVYIASIAQSRGAAVATLDRDFRRINDVQVVEPR